MTADVQDTFDVIVIGGGHAGAEAAAAARFGARTALVTHKLFDHWRDVVQPGHWRAGQGASGAGGPRAWTAPMGRRTADRGGASSSACSTGPRGRATRPQTQADRKLYREAVQSILGEYEKNLILIEDERLSSSSRRRMAKAASQASFDGRGRTRKAGRRRGDHGDIPQRSLIHIGEKRIPAGRVGEGTGDWIASDRLYGLGLQMGRLKTGTPARLNGKTIDWSDLEMQEADAEPHPVPVPE